MMNPFRSFRASPDATLLFVLTCLLLVGCQTRDLSRNPSEATDFRLGQTYQLKVPAFILARTGLVMTVDESRKHDALDVEVLLEPGTYFTVRQIMSVKDSPPRTEIYAEIVSGPSKARVVNLRTASLTDGPMGTTRRNPAVLEPFFFMR